MPKLPRSFYNHPSLEVAPLLLGKLLVHQTDGHKLIGRIVEVEAYMGPTDKAAHSYNNLRTPRNEIMYGEAGFTYVYYIYGMYYCFNIVTNEINIPHAILIRALEPIGDVEQMAINRYQKGYASLTKKEINNLTNGPGKLCKALNITKKDNGIDLLSDDIYILDDDYPRNIKQSKRINIDYAKEAINYPWRFYLCDNPYVSKPHE